MNESTQAYEYGGPQTDWLASANAGAKADVTAIVTAPDATPASTEPAAAAAGTPVEATPAVQATGTTYKVKVNGEDMEVPLDELLKGYSRHSDYTKKTMELAEQRKQHEAVLAAGQQAEQLKAEMRAFLQDRAKLDAFYKEAYGTAPPLSPQAQQAIDPDSLPTVGQVDYLVQQRLTQAQREMQMGLDKLAREQDAKLQQQQLASIEAEYDQEINAHITKALAAQPLLKGIEKIDKLVREDVAEELAPKFYSGEKVTMEDAKRAYLESIERRAQAQRHLLETHAKETAVAASKVKSAIEPPGGVGVKPPEPRKLTLMPKDKKDLIAAAIADIQASMR